MPNLIASQLGWTFADGDRLFSDLNFCLSAQRTGLVGRNGAGKSVLAALIAGRSKATSGTVSFAGSVGYFSQQPEHTGTYTGTVAQFLGIAPVLDALARIEQGECSEALFELAEGQWELRESLCSQLGAIGVPARPDMPCSQLSGGQQARLRLWQLFEQQPDLLVLDEPSNHMDSAGRAWLSEQIRTYPGQVLVVSHDRQLLSEMEQIWELSTLGLRSFGGNYHDYRETKLAEEAAVVRQQQAVSSELRQLEVQAQRNQEKADQRAAQGIRIRRSGSQPKILLNGMRSKATLAASSRLKNDSGRREKLQAKADKLAQRSEQIRAQKLHLESEPSATGYAVRLVNARLPFGSGQAVNLCVSGKMELRGANGSGKSTLMRVLTRELELAEGELSLRVPVCYLDQHFGLVKPALSLAENLEHYCSHLGHSDIRTLLAGIGFRRDSVWRKAADLSGGEKMKLAMLIVTHQPQQPLLLLDEPDNHLDLDSREMLATALAGYRGPFLLVSHDPEFVQQSGVSNYYQLM